MIEHKRIIDAEYLIDWAVNNGTSRKTAENSYKSFLFGYEAWEDGVLLGTAYSTFREGEYTLDGYNLTNNIFQACILGRMVIKELFENYTDIIYTYHKSKLNSVTALAKRLGFEDGYLSGKQTILVLEKKHGNG
jgi:hypothetical protein